MNIFITHIDEERVIFLARPEGSNTIGDAKFEVKSGQNFQGKTYEDLVDLGIGEHEI